MIHLHLVHPAQYHLFKHIITKLDEDKIETLVTIKDREFLQTLLSNNCIKFESMGPVPQSKLLKLLLIPLYVINTLLFLHNKDIKILLSCGSLDQMLVSKILNVPLIVMDDTDDNWFIRKTSLPFSNKVFVPRYYKKYNNSDNLVFYNSCHEHSYLSPKVFTPDKKIVSKYKFKIDEPYFIVSFASLDASHDVGHNQSLLVDRIRLIKEIEKFGKVFILSEVKLPRFLDKFKLEIEPEDFHDVLSYSSGHIGEGITTGIEASILGIPAIIINSRDDGPNIKLLKKFGMIKRFDTIIEALPNIKYYLNKSKDDLRKKSLMMSKELIDVPDFMYREIKKEYGKWRK